MQATAVAHLGYNWRFPAIIIYSIKKVIYWLSCLPSLLGLGVIIHLKILPFNFFLNCQNCDESIHGQTFAGRTKPGTSFTTPEGVVRMKCTYFVVFTNMA